MSDLAWRADGIARAKAAGGIELETYRRPGFSGGVGVRRSDVGGNCQGYVDTGYFDPDPPADDSAEARA